MANALGDYLKELRGKESLRSVASRLNGELSHSYISDLEKGQSRRGNVINPSPETLKSLASVYNANYEKLMELAGYIDEKERNDIGNVKISGTIPAEYTIPILGRIAASAPSGLVSDYEGEISIQPSTVKRYGRKDIFALRVLGDSMNRIVPEGSIAVIYKTCDWEDGDICAVTINGDDATLKQVFRTERGIRFIPLSYSKFHAAWEYIKDEDEVDVIIHGVFLYGIIPTDKM